MWDLVKTFISPVNQFIRFWHVIPDNDPDINEIDQYARARIIFSKFLTISKLYSMFPQEFHF